MRAPKRLEIEGLLCTRPARRAEPAAEPTVGDEAGERLRELLRVSWRDEHARLAVDDLLRHSTDPAGDDRERCRHRLEDGNRHAFGGAGQHEDVRLGKQLRHVTALAHEPHVPDETKPADLVLESRAVGPVTDDHRLERIGFKSAKRSNESEEVLRCLQSTDCDDERPRAASALDTASAGDVDGIPDDDGPVGIARARSNAEPTLAFGDAHTHRRQRANEPVRPTIDAPDEARIGCERPPVNGEHADRHTRDNPGQATQQTGFRAACMEDVWTMAPEQPHELDEAGDVASSDRPPDVFERLETSAGRDSRVPEWTVTMSRDDDLEALGERREQRGDISLSTADFRERDEQQNARPPRLGG